MSIGNAFGSHDGYLKIIGNTDDKGLFLFGMFDDPKNFMPPSYATLRCDYHAPLALTGFHYWQDGSCNCGLTDKPYPRTLNHWDLEEVSALFVVIDSSPFGAIMYVEFAENEEKHLSQRGNALTRTLQEQFRFLIEWKYAHEHLGNNERIAITASNFINQIDLPINIQEWILSDVPNEQVNRFLEGRTDALQRTQDPIPDLTNEFKEWLLTKFKKAKNFGDHQ
jgi:hypothetical protein